ncbi:hypothetical protein LFL96_28240 [Paraburkholderia sp. D15]|uniref:hypothetical protein n=1 Tax=Paraburkholderia sp. D15 TaxID=2880218 RepID=UPI002478D428|nr:hypothetical protein [Paraburkholderia sp. D15]WGS52094.1 hypothetical protein LFL96_28240 [Paraburkholderia sp. D15]WKF59625.1 hypothetical protein HUO10_004136 [Paraburkholderia busanensis]
MLNHLLLDAFAIIKRHKGAFIALNVAYFGLAVISMIVTLHHPELKTTFQSSIDQGYAKPGLFKTVADAYVHRELLPAITLTFLVNLVVASFGMTTLPSFVVPFAGIFVQLYRAFQWGVTFAPIGPLRMTLIPHSLTLLIEGEAYVLAALAAYVQARKFLWPRHYRRDSHLAGYKAGAISTARLYVLIALVLLVAAIYEVIESVYLMPLFLSS